MNTEKEIRITLTLNEEERIELMDILREYIQMCDKKVDKESAPGFIKVVIRRTKMAAEILEGLK